MHSSNDTHHNLSTGPPSPPSPPAPPPRFSPHSDSGLSVSSSSSSEIMGTPFDLGTQRFEYPFPKAQGSPTDPFLPLSSSISSHSHAQSPPWSIHISKSFPLTQPPLGKFTAHPKLRSANVREPPVPPGLVKRRSRINGLQHQSSSEEPSDKSDVNDEIARAKRSPRFVPTSSLIPRHPSKPDDAKLNTSEMILVKQAASFPIGSLHRPTVGGHIVLATSPSPPERTPCLPVPQRERKVNHMRNELHSFSVYCWVIASQLCQWVFRFLGWFSRA